MSSKPGQACTLCQRAFAPAELRVWLIRQQPFTTERGVLVEGAYTSEADQYTCIPCADGTGISALFDGIVRPSRTHELEEALAQMTAERDEALAALAREEHAHGMTIEQRDAYHRAADTLAYAIAPVEVIGEHSNLNAPWDNALEALAVERRKHTEETALHSQIARLNGERAMREAAFDLLDAEACKMQKAADAVRSTLHGIERLNVRASALRVMSYRVRGLVLDQGSPLEVPSEAPLEEPLEEPIEAAPSEIAGGGSHE